MRRYTELGKAIRAARDRKKISQKELGKRLGVSRQRIIAWEGGKHRPQERYRRSLEEVLNVPEGTFDIGPDLDALEKRLDELHRQLVAQA